MDESMLIDGVLRSVLGGRRKRSRRAERYLGGPLAGSMGSIGGSLLSNPNMLLTAAGLAWGIYETLQESSPAGAAPASAPAPVPPDPSAASAPLPPLPDVASDAPVSDQALQIVRLAVSAAYADGSVSDEERTAILEHARGAGVDAILEQELAQPRPLAEIVADVTGDDQRATLYVLAFGIVRGDEQPTGAERIYLAKLAHLLGLEPKTVQQLEQNAARRIDAQPGQ
jgi:uncharacterized membrane protein YebE (DUF533 family)